MIKHSLMILASTAFMSLPAASIAGDAGVPEKAQLCVACHGPAGTQPILPDYPVIGGQYPDYLKKTLQEYKSGVRKNPVMSAQAAQLSEAEIKQLSKYFGAQESPLYTPSIPSAAGE